MLITTLLCKHEITQSESNTIMVSYTALESDSFHCDLCVPYKQKLSKNLSKALLDYNEDNYRTKMNPVAAL